MKLKEITRKCASQNLNANIKKFQTFLNMIIDRGNNAIIKPVSTFVKDLQKFFDLLG